MKIPMTDRDLAGCALSDVLALLEKATPGEWSGQYANQVIAGGKYVLMTLSEYDPDGKIYPTPEQSGANRDAICAAVNFLRQYGPELLSRAPSRDAESPAEKGPYRAINAGGKVVVESEDFTHDVWLYVTGDFGSDGQHMSYAEWIAETLNAAIAAAERENHG